MTTFTKNHIDLTAGRTELHDLLSLTGAEVSLNNLPAGASVPFVHSHTENEEIYIVLEGHGRVYLDGSESEISAGDVLRVAPACERCFAAAADSAVRFLCIQVKENSLTNFTMSDGKIADGKKASWL